MKAFLWISNGCCGKKITGQGQDGSWDNPNKFLQGLVIFFYSKLCESATGSLASICFVVNSNNPIASGIQKVLICLSFSPWRTHLSPSTLIKQTVFDFTSYLNWVCATVPESLVGVWTRQIFSCFTQDQMYHLQLAAQMLKLVITSMGKFKTMLLLELFCLLGAI